MRSGIEKSGALLLFLSKGVLRRPFVQFEVRTAKELGKQIILVHESDKVSDLCTAPMQYSI